MPFSRRCLLVEGAFCRRCLLVEGAFATNYTLTTRYAAVRFIFIVWTPRSTVTPLVVVKANAAAGTRKLVSAIAGWVGEKEML